MYERTEFYERVKERLIRYAKVDTQSMRGGTETPTTRKQFDLARMLFDELKTLGADDVYLDERACVVYAFLPSTMPDGGGVPFGIVTHMDTAPDAPGAPVRPWVLEAYDGGTIVLNAEQGITMSPAAFPNLLSYVGQDLILTDGTTLLGGDDKAAIASVMTYLEHCLKHPELPHGPVSFAFTPDEEVGGLAKDLDFDRFQAKVAYTLDGDHLGWYMDETFNASEATLRVKGLSVHPATAKGVMINAADVAGEFLQMLPRFEKPQYTCGREGFFHVIALQADCEAATVTLIVRDHDPVQFQHREAYLATCADALKAQYGADRVSLSIEPSYRNMKEVVDRHPYLIENLTQAIRAAGLEPQTEPFRGGTDGSALSWRGLPCPNLSAGYENAHGRFEYVPIPSMEKNVEILLHLGARFGAMKNDRKEEK
ncbi:MAG: peptidase T [Clostridia bacterium]|nr:peptidase T [Clostridia bacterium]